MTAVSVGVGCDIDNDNFNELQSISFTANGDSLLINNGAGVQLSAVPPSAGQVLTWNGINWEATNASPNNIYTNDGTLTGARTVTIGANTLDFNTTAVSGFNINSNTFNVNGTNGFVGIGVSPTVGKFSVVHNSTTSNPVVNISNPTSSLNRMHFRNGPTSSKFWEIGAATKATDASSGWTVSYDDGAGNYNYHLAVYGDGKVAVGDSINNSNSSIFDVFGSTTLHDTLTIKTDHGPGYSFPVVDGFANYLMQTDGLGVVTWVDPTTLGTSLWTDAGTATYLTDLTDSVGIGTVSPFAKFHVLTDGGANQVVSHAISNTTDDAGTIALLRAKGSLGSETAVQNGDRIGQIVFNGYNSSSTIYEEAAYISVSAEENYTSTGAGSRMEFHTAQIGGSTTEAMVITSGQNVGIGVATPAQKLSVEATSGNVSAVQGVNNQTGTGSDSHGLFGSTANDYFGSAGVKGEASGADGMGMFGVASTGSASGYGVFGDYKGTGGGTGVAGRIDNASASASSIGVHGINFSQGPGVASFVKNGTSGEKTSMLVEATTTTPAPGMGSRIDFATGTTFNSTEVIASITATSTNINQGSSEGDLSFSTVQGGGTIRTKRMTILSGGNVGIGTTTPSNKLEVIGDAAKFDSVIIVNGANAGYVLTSDASGNASWAESSSNNVVISLTNRTGIASNKGDVIVADPANPNSFIFTNSPGNATVLGVVYESGVANLGACKVAISGVVEVNVSATPILGQHCVTSLSNGQAASVSTPGAGTSIGVWIDATPGAEKVLLR